MPIHSNRRLRALVTAGVIVGLAGCGGDDGTDDLAAYCRDVVTLDQMFQNFDAEDPSSFESALAVGISLV